MAARTPIKRKHSDDAAHNYSIGESAKRAANEDLALHNASHESDVHSAKKGVDLPSLRPQPGHAYATAAAAVTGPVKRGGPRAPRTAGGGSVVRRVNDMHERSRLEA